MITAHASIVKVLPGYYPRLTVVLNRILFPHNRKTPYRVKGRHTPLLMTPEAIKRRAYKAERKRRMKGVQP